MLKAKNAAAKTALSLECYAWRFTRVFFFGRPPAAGTGRFQRR
jgi:hypothetical protein